MHLLEPSTVEITVRMNVVARHSDYVLVQHGKDPFGEAFICNARTGRAIVGYPSLDDDNLLDDWNTFTGWNYGQEG